MYTKVGIDIFRIPFSMLPAASPAIQLLAPILVHNIPRCVHDLDAAFVPFQVLVRGPEHQQGVDLGALAQLLLPLGLPGLLFQLVLRLRSAS